MAVRNVLEVKGIDIIASKEDHERALNVYIRLLDREGHQIMETSQIAPNVGAFGSIVSHHLRLYHQLTYVNVQMEI